MYYKLEVFRFYNHVSQEMDLKYFMHQKSVRLKFKISLVLIFAHIGFVAAARAAEHPLILGVVEQSPSHYSGEVSTTPFMVRAAFYWQENAWKSFPSEGATPEGLKKEIDAFPKEVTWTIAFDGTNRGQFHTSRPSKWSYYSDIGLLQPDQAAQITLIPNGPQEFAYWQPTVYRPLITVSKPNVADPDHWKKSNVPPEVLHQLIPFFRKEVGSAPLSCDGKKTSYEDKLIRAHKSYLSAAGNRLVQLALDDSAVRECDGPRDESYDSRWFYVQGHEIRFLGQSLELIDAGAYDNGDHSDVVFHKSGYNMDGYILFYDRLRKKAEFNWSYQ